MLTVGAVNVARLDALKFYVEEGIWRLGILDHLDIHPTIDLMIAPIQSISIIFLRLDRLIDAKLKDYPLKKGETQLENVMVAEKWLELSSIVRQRAREKSDILEGVVSFVANYYDGMCDSLTLSILVQERTDGYEENRSCYSSSKL